MSGFLYAKLKCTATAERGKITKYGKIKRYRGKVKRFKAKLKSVGAKCNCIALGYYLDDGSTGTNFKRPAFLSMIEEAKKGRIDAIIVKDLSRLGRNYIDVGDYLEQIFPTLGVRVIAVNSYYDSKNHEGDVIGLDVAINNIVNNMYSADLSKKIKSAFRAKWKQGISTNGVMPYGYRSDPETKEKWIVDDEAAEVVRLIFDRAASGWSLHMIADELNAKKIDTPNKYHRRKGTKNYYRKVSDKEDLWNVEQLRVMIRRQEYAGASVNHKRESVHMGIETKHIPEREWFIRENAHTPIVSRETYEKAQDIIKNSKKSDYIIPLQFVLKKKIRCGNCKLMMNYSVTTYEESCYCSHAKNTGRYSKCNTQKVSIKHIEETVYRTVKGYYKDLKLLDGLVGDAVRGIRPDYEKKVREAKDQIEILRQERIRQYEGYASGQITAERYMKTKEKLTLEIDRLTQEYEQAKEFVQYDDGICNEVKRLKDIACTETKQGKLTKKMVDAFIDTIYVYDKDRIEVKLKCADFISKAVERHNIIVDELLSDCGEGEESLKEDDHG